MRTGVFSGTFDPFTIGHADIVRRALQVVDRLHILISVNLNKKPFLPLEERVETLQKLYADDDRVSIHTNNDLTAKYAQSLDNPLLIRGIRSVTDMEYERTMADVNLLHFGVDTIFLMASPELNSISSTVVRELAAFGEDYSRYLP